MITRRSLLGFFGAAPASYCYKVASNFYDKLRATYPKTKWILPEITHIELCFTGGFDGTPHRIIYTLHLEDKSGNKSHQMFQAVYPVSGQGEPPSIEEYLEMAKLQFDEEISRSLKW